MRRVLSLVLVAACGGGSVDVAVDGGDATDGSNADAAPEADFGALPWTEIGVGVAYKDSGNPRGADVFIGYAGYGVDDAGARNWVTALYQAALRTRGVRHVFAVRGPASVQYTEKEIQNSLLIATMLPALAPDGTITIAAHSSGARVACELLSQLYEQGLDPDGASDGRIAYFDLDGLYGCLDETVAGHLRALHFVYAASGADTSLNADDMQAGAGLYGVEPQAYDASASGCQPDASLCLHVSLVNTRPHDPSTGSPADYADFDGRPVNTWYLDAAGD